MLEQKLIAEKHLRASGMDWTIVRPGGLKADPPTGALFVSGENTLNSGEISRDLVADVVAVEVEQVLVRARLLPRHARDARRRRRLSRRALAGVLRRARDVGRDGFI